MSGIGALIKEPAQVKQRLTLDTLATLYGCCGLFDVCGDADLMSLTLEKSNRFLDWVGWTPSDVCIIKKNFINWIRPETQAGRQGVATPGWLSDPCADPYSVEFGTCEFELEDFARLRRASPVRDVTKGHIRYCQAQPRYRLDGTLITDEKEYSILLATEAIIQDLKHMMVIGNSTTAGQFDGLQRLIRTGYDCTSMDSIVVNWNSNDMGGGAGITWNGNAVSATLGFFDVLNAVVRRIKHRIMLSPALSNRQMAVGDMVLMLPYDFAGCVLDAFTCWSVCDSDADAINTLEARRYRDNLLGGMFGAGRIYIDGMEIPIMPYDWDTIVGPTTFDAYLLTNQIGGVRVMEGQYNDMRVVARSIVEGMAPRYYLDGGRILTWNEFDETCFRSIVEMQPRLLMWAPWAQARIQNIVCALPGGPLSPDPFETSFFPETSFSAAECP